MTLLTKVDNKMPNMTTRPQASFIARPQRLRTALAGLFAATLAALFSPAATAADAATPKLNAAQAAAVTPPDAAAVLGTLYEVDTKGADSAKVGNGRTATYWFGHAFELGGTRYFTGFIWNTRDTYGKPIDDAGPDTQVNLAEVTYTLNGSSPERPWKFRGLEYTIGQFGAYEKPEAVDTRRKPLEYRTPAGKLVLAVPTEGFETGVSFEGYALFVFNIEPRDSKDNVWSYVGSILTGDDNSAACDEGAVMPCAARSGKLEFVAQSGSDLPRLTVTPSGTMITGPDKTRKLGAADTVTYVYDAATKKYAEK